MKLHSYEHKKQQVGLSNFKDESYVWYAPNKHY